MIIKTRASSEKKIINEQDDELRLVKLEHSNGKLGFSLRGGKDEPDSSVGFFVCHVESNGEAQLKGLKVGDRLLKVNGKEVERASYDQVIKWIKETEKDNKLVRLLVKNVGQIPVQERNGQAIEWIRVADNNNNNNNNNNRLDYIEKLSSCSGEDEGIESSSSQRSVDWHAHSSIDEPQENEEEEAEELEEGDEARVESVRIKVKSKRAEPFGCGVVKGPDDWPGVYVQTVRSNSLAERVGLEVGDQIVKAQGRSLGELTFEAAILFIKKLQTELEQQEFELQVIKGAAFRYLEQRRRRNRNRIIKCNDNDNYDCDYDDDDDDDDEENWLSMRNIELEPKVTEHNGDSISGTQNQLSVKVKLHNKSETETETMNKCNEFEFKCEEEREKEEKRMRKRNDSLNLGSVDKSNGKNKIEEEEEDKFVNGSFIKCPIESNRNFVFKKSSINIMNEMESPKIKIVNQNCLLHNRKEAARQLKLANLLRDRTFIERDKLIEQAQLMRSISINKSKQQQSQVYQYQHQHQRMSNIQRYLSMDNLSSKAQCSALKRNEIEQVHGYASPIGYSRRNSLIMIANHNKNLINSNNIDCCKLAPIYGPKTVTSVRSVNRSNITPSSGNIMFNSNTINCMPTARTRMSKSKSVDKLNFAQNSPCSVELSKLSIGVQRQRTQPQDKSRILCNSLEDSCCIIERQRNRADCSKVESSSDSMRSAATCSRAIKRRLATTNKQLPRQQQQQQHEQVHLSSYSSCSICFEQAAIEMRRNQMSQIENRFKASDYRCPASGSRLKFDVNKKCQESFSCCRDKKSQNNFDRCCDFYADQMNHHQILKSRYSNDETKKNVPISIQIKGKQQTPIAASRLKRDRRNVSTFISNNNNKPSFSSSNSKNIDDDSCHYRAAGSDEISPICTPTQLTSTESSEDSNCISISSASSRLSSSTSVEDCDEFDNININRNRNRNKNNKNKNKNSKNNRSVAQKPPCPPPLPGLDPEFERTIKREQKEFDGDKITSKLCFVDELKILAKQQKSPELESNTLIKIINASKQLESKNNNNKNDNLNSLRVKKKLNEKCVKCNNKNNQQQKVCLSPSSSASKFKLEGEIDKRRQHELLMREFKSVHSRMFSKRNKEKSKVDDGQDQDQDQKEHEHGEEQEKEEKDQKFIIKTKIDNRDLNGNDIDNLQDSTNSETVHF